MNRKIIFRAKRPDNNDWVYGDLLHPSCVSAGYEIHPYIRDRHACAHEVYKDTIGQFTGLIDSAGKEVYEFDIMKDEGSERLYVVYFNEDSMRFMRCPVEFYDGNKTLITVHNSQPMDVWRWRNIKRYVIGNIHDNPELIKEEQL